MKAALALLLLPCLTACGADSTSNVRVLEGSFTVSFRLQTSESSSRSSAQDEIRRISFHDSYVLIENEKGSGQLLPTDRLVNFTWSVDD